jgi:hypothetical protein
MRGRDFDYIKNVPITHVVKFLIKFVPELNSALLLLRKRYWSGGS